MNKFLPTLVLILGVFVAMPALSQTIIFGNAAGDGVTLGTEAEFTVVANPVLDGVNGSSSVMKMDAPAGWKGLTINLSAPISATNNKLYISFYNPSGYTENQVQLNFENPNQQWLSEAHNAAATTGWYERVIDLSAFEGETLNWMWIAPAGGDAGVIYFDNIYLSDASSDAVTEPFNLSPSAVIFADAAGDYVTLGAEEQVSAVANPMVDAVNGSPTVLMSDAADAWKGYTIDCAVPVTDTTKYLYISFYNPGGLTENQVQVNFMTPNQQWLSEAHNAAATTGWYERVIDLSAFIGDTLNWMWIAPSAGEAGKIYFDNIYLGDATNETVTMPFRLSATGIIFDEEAGDEVTLGTEEHISIVDNPMKDAENDSDKVIKSNATASWSGFTIHCNIAIADTAAYLYVSMYNPEDAIENQVQVNFRTPNQQWLTEAFPDEATTGWFTRVVDMTAFVGDTLNWMWLAPTAGQAKVSYMDNIFMGPEPQATSVNQVFIESPDVYYSDGMLRFKNIPMENVQVVLYDIAGRMIQKEEVRGTELQTNSSMEQGIYIIQIRENNQLKMSKKLYIQ